MEHCSGEIDRNLAAIDGWHGCYGHVNVFTLDHDSEVTGYGKHDRIVAFCPDTTASRICEGRIDHLWNLGAPTERQIIKAFKARNGSYMPGRWKLKELIPGHDGKSTDVILERVY